MAARGPSGGLLGGISAPPKGAMANEFVTIKVGGSHRVDRRYDTQT